MSVDIAIGPGWPIASPVIESADNPAALCELTYGIKDIENGLHCSVSLPERNIKREEGKSTLVHAMAYQEKQEGILIRSSYINLMPFIDIEKNIFSYNFPKGENSRWKIFAFYSQPSCQKINAGQTYVIDHLSRAGALACQKYWDELLNENKFDSVESLFCDSLEYQDSLDWTPDFPEEFEKRRGYSILPYLPVIGVPNLYPPCEFPGYQFDDPSAAEMINADYLETLTECYCENHLAVLQSVAEKYGKTVRYQVAYNKPFEVERSALFVDIPENEALGRPAIDYMKTMAAAAHLGRKERYSFECAAEFGNSYGQSYEDLFWWIKRSFMAGMNAQVLHGASYSGKYMGVYSENGQIPGTNWPGYEGFGKVVSNYWNRTPSVDDARRCMDVITRLNIIFRKTAKIDCAILRTSYINDGNGSEFCIYQDDGYLTNQGYSYEFVSEKLLQLSSCTVSNGVLDEEGPAYKCLVVPEQDKLSSSVLYAIRNLALQGLKIIWIGKRPEKSIFYADWNSMQKQTAWKELLMSVWGMKEIVHVSCYKEVPEALRKHNIFPEVILSGDTDVMTSVRYDQDSHMRFYGLYAYNRVRYSPDDPNPDELSVSALYAKGTTKGSYQRPGRRSRRKIPVKIKGNGKVYLCDPWSGIAKPVNFINVENGYMGGNIIIEEDELILLVLNECEKAEIAQDTAPELKENYEQKGQADIAFDMLELEKFQALQPKEISFLRSGFVKTDFKIRLNQPVPWKDIKPELQYFSGRGTYTGTIYLKEKRKDCSYILELGEVSDTFTVFINGKKTSFPDQVMKRVDITEQIHEGKNDFKIIVVSNLYNCLFHENMESCGIKLPYVPRKYGIWESENKKIEIRARIEV